MAYMRGERLCGDARGDFGRCCRTRALLLDAISAGQVVLEDVRTARLAGLRMVAREWSAARRVARVSAGGAATNHAQSWSSARYPYCARAASRCVKWRRRLTFLKAGRGQTTSSSSAILLKKIRTTAMRSCSRTSQPRNCTRSFFPPRAEDFDKDGNS